jgi:phospholipid/cholesterol/gamma-HCH transport system substrate-binding protein
MSGRREQVWVGSFVLIAVAVLVIVVLAVSGTFSKKGVAHRASFKFTGGVAPAAPVRFGGLEAGRVERLRVDPADPTRVEVHFSVAPDIPVKTDSIAKVAVLGPLGDPYLELTTGSRDAPLAPPGSLLQSQELVAITDLAQSISELIPAAKQVLVSLNDRLGEVKQTVAQANDLLGDQNRKNISGALATLNGMLTETRPEVAATLKNVREASDKFPQLATNLQNTTERLTPVIDDLKGAIAQARETLAHVDAITVENRPDIRASVANVRGILDKATELVELLNTTLDRNSDNLDETLVNVRSATINMQELTDSLKRKPSLLLRGETGTDRKPGDKR